MTPQTVTEPPQPPFLTHFDESMSRISGALTELLASVGADPNGPRELARRFAVNRNMAWKVTRIVNATDPCEAFQHLPGSAGIDILLKAMGDEGAPRECVEAVRASFEGFDAMVETHAGDRGTLELMLASMLPGRMDPSRLESSRKLSFQGNSATLGVQMRVRSGVSIVAPNAERPEFIDLGVVTGLYGVRRLRPITRWPLVQSRLFAHEDDGSAPLDPSVAPGEVPFLRDFCSETLPETSLRETPNGFACELEEGPVGTSAAFDSVFGWWVRPLAKFQSDEEGQLAEFTATCDAPAELFVYDLLVHRSL